MSWCYHVLYVSIKPVVFFAFRETEEPATENEKIVDAEKPHPEKQSGEEDAGDVNKENPVNEPEEKEPENKVSIYLKITVASFWKYVGSKQESFKPTTIFV